MPLLAANSKAMGVSEAQLRLHELDLIRLAGAMGIVLYHYTFRGPTADDLSALNFPALGSVFRYGQLGVYVFFILSGYTIVSSARTKDLRNFVLARFLHLYPSYWIAVCLTASATFIWGGDRFFVEPKQFIFNLTMLNEYVGVKSVDSAYWFLSVILRFYFVIAVLILLGLVRFQKHFAGIWLAAALAANVIHIPGSGFLLIPNYAPFFIAGIIFFSAREEGWDAYKSLLVLITLLFAYCRMERATAGFARHFNTEFSFPVFFSIILFIYAFMFFSTVSKRRLRLPGVFAVAAACTYPLYLIHQHIGYMLFNSYGHLANKYLVLTLAVFIMCLISFLMTRYADPFIAGMLKKTLRKEICAAG